VGANLGLYKAFMQKSAIDISIFALFVWFRLRYIETTDVNHILSGPENFQLENFMLNAVA